MARLLKLIIRTMLVLAFFVVAAFAIAFFSPRPPLSIDPATLAGDGSIINYCELPELDAVSERHIDKRTVA